MADWDMANTDALKWAQKHNFDLTYAGIDLTPEQNQALQQEIARHIEGLQTVRQLAQRLAPMFGEEQARTIAVTEVTRAYAEGNQAAWREPGVTEGKEWNTANDNDVCDTCAMLHDYIVPIDQRFLGKYDGPPAHTECRCWLSPVPLRDNQRIEGGKVVTVEITKRDSQDRPRWQFWK